MIKGLKGKIIKKELNYILLEVNNVIYEIMISLNSYSNIIIDNNIFIYISEIINENSYILYGFIDENEQKIFDKLIKINGIGPKIALNICSSFSPSIFSQIINTKNIEVLKKVSGIGNKSANRIIIELNNLNITNEEDNINVIEIIKTLENLGFNKKDINQVLKDIEFNSIEETIKIALKKLSKV